MLKTQLTKIFKYNQMNGLFRKIAITVVLLALIAYSAFYAMQKQPTQLSPQAKVVFSGNDLRLKIVYCQPYKKGRLIFGTQEEDALQPFGQYWRLGANEATTIETNKDLMISNQKLPKGAYSIYAIPGKETWKIGFNKVADRWGITEPDYSKDLFRIEVPVNYTQNSKEQFSITITNNAIEFWWDTSKIVIPYEVTN